MLSCFNLRAGMFVYGLAFLLGVVFLQQYSVLPSRIFVASFSAILFSCAYFLSKPLFHWDNSSAKHFVNVAFVLGLLIYLGFVVAFITGERAINNHLDDSYAGVNILIKGTVSSIPITNGASQRFEFMVDNYHFIDNQKDCFGDCLSMTKLPKKIRLSWYYGSRLNTDEKWQLEVRLKPPHGFMNPGGFDYEKWLFLKGISATGYVTKSNKNKLLHTASPYSINRFRQSLSSQIDQLEDSSRHSTLSMVKALAIGDKSSITEQQWQVLTNTGTSHLMAISGLHIGLAALFINVVVRRTVPVVLMKYFPAQHLALMAGMLMALLYALVAGLSVPTQRALIMLIVLSILLLLRRNHRPLDALGFALVMVLMFDPMAVLSVGFWFSFSAVAVIFISIIGGLEEQDGLNDKVTTQQKIIKTLRHWLHLQIVLSLFLLPLSLFMFKQVSLVSPLANLLLIPYVSFLVVPVVLIAMLISFVNLAVSNALFELAGQMLNLIWPVLTSFSSQTFSLWQYDGIGVIELFVTSFTLVTLYFSKTLSKKLSKPVLSLWLIRFLLLLILFCCFAGLFNISEQTLQKGEIKLTVLDVGQGSSAVIQTQHHVLVYDAGARFSNKLDSGKDIIIPFLHSEDITAIDTLVISHGDADHIGGAQSLLDEYTDVKLLGQDIEKLKSENKQLCYSGIAWQWDGVDFKFLLPETPDYPNTNGLKQFRNNHSCVLQVSSHFGSILLTGDIEKEMEQTLLNNYKNKLASDVLVVPHHGSATSSTMPFITTVNPKIAIISVGYKNRYNLPNHRVLERYRQHYKGSNNRVFQTYRSGAISITLKHGHEIKLQQFRENMRKYWHHL